MDFSGLSKAVSNNAGWIAIILVVGMIVWKFILQPIQNENEPVPEIPQEELDQE